MIKWSLSQENKNYGASIVALKEFRPISGCDAIKGAIIYGNHVIVGANAVEGEAGVFFPVETQISKDFLSKHSLFRSADLNADKDKRGFFEDSGRVRAIKLRGAKSEGFFIPLSEVVWPAGLLVPPIGSEFDTINGVEICKKYVPPASASRAVPVVKIGKRMMQLVDTVARGTFAFHEDTENLRRNADKIVSGERFTVTDKINGTSAIFAHLPCLRQLSWFERIKRALGFFVDEYEWGIVASSRRVVKSVSGKSRAEAGFYGEDIWSVVAQEIGHKIPKGYSVYGEIVGFTPGGKAIQSGYSYGCGPREHKFFVYRVCVAALGGERVDLGRAQIEAFCKKAGLEPVPLLLEAVLEFDSSETNDEVVSALDSQFVQGRECSYNPGKPAEGIVVRLENEPKFTAYKLKNFDFLELESKALDKGDAGITE